MGAEQRGAQSPDVVELTVPSDARFLEVIYACTEQICRQTGCLSQDEIYKIAWGVHEACVNVIEHAHHFAACEPLHVEMAVTVRAIEFRIYDRGAGFNLRDIPDEDPSPETERGRGLFSMRQCMDVVEYDRGAACNCLHLVRRIARVRTAARSS